VSRGARAEKRNCRLFTLSVRTDISRIPGIVLPTISISARLHNGIRMFRTEKSYAVSAVAAKAAACPSDGA
jgi:hypothetical protein